MPGITPSGLEIKTLTEIEGEQQDALRANISPTLNLSSTSIIGEHVGITSSHLSELWDAMMAIWQSWDITTAKDAALDRLAALTGTVRREALPSTVLMTLDLDAGTYPAGSLVVNLVGDGSVRFSNAEEIVLLSDNPSLAGQLFESEEVGPVQAAAGQLTVISTPVVGFNSATNPNDAVAGSFRETNQELRRRQAEELARPGSATVDAIRADVLQVPGVTFATVIENDTDSTVDGIPPHAFETLVIGGAAEDIAQAIFLTKPAGIRAYGQTTEGVTDSQGNGHLVGFTRPTDLNVWVIVELKYMGGQYIGNSAVAQAINDWGDQNLSPGHDVLYSRLLQIVMSLPGVVDAELSIGTSDPPTMPTNVVVGVREIARLDVSRILVASVPVSGVP